jgi:hypothetical protein
LYMPRGYVHHAQTVPSVLPPTPSFHITIALATHDWTFAGVVSSLCRMKLFQTINWRKALPREIGRQDSHIGRNHNENMGPKTRRDRFDLKDELANAWEMLQAEITTESIELHLREKYDSHNARATMFRQQAMSSATKQRLLTNKELKHRLGKEAASYLTNLDRIQIRVATEIEKQDLANNNASNGDPRGLNVRPDVHDSIIEILTRLRNQPTQLYTIRQLRELLPTPNATAIMSTSTTTGSSTSFSEVSVSSAQAISSTSTSNIGRGIDAPLSDADRQMLQRLHQSQYCNQTIKEDRMEGHRQLPPVCDLTLLCFARQCVTLGALAIALE